MMNEAVELQSQATEGLYRGDLKPLATLLRSGHPITHEIAWTLATCIDHPDEAYYRLKLIKKRGAPPLPFWDAVKSRDEMIAIGHFVEQRCAKRSDQKNAVADAEKTFGKSRKTIMKALGRYRAWVAEGRVENGGWVTPLGWKTLKTAPASE